MKRRSVWVVEMADKQFGWVKCQNGSGLSGWSTKHDADKHCKELRERFPTEHIFRVVRYDASKSAAKAAASRENGKLGGRPRKQAGAGRKEPR